MERLGHWRLGDGRMGDESGCACRGGTKKIPTIHGILCRFSHGGTPRSSSTEIMTRIRRFAHHSLRLPLLRFTLRDPIEKMLHAIAFAPQQMKELAGVKVGGILTEERF